MPAALILLVACGDGGSTGAVGGPRVTDTALFDPYAAGFVGDPVAGEARFRPRCAACHGEDGHGALGPDLRTRVPRHDDLALYRVFTEGRGGMPAIDVAPQEGVDLVAYLRLAFGRGVPADGG